MAHLSVSRSSHMHPGLSRLFSLRSISIHPFCTTPTPTSTPTPDAHLPEIEPISPPLKPSPSRLEDLDSDRASIHSRTPRVKHQSSEKIEDIICRMMANRAWTTRLQSSIRKLVPAFDNELVYNVLHSAKNSEHALQFFRWVERSGLFKHNRETHLKIIETLGRASKLNHARCILLDMPKKGVEWDEDLWVLMIDSYGKEGIVQESVKMFQKMESLGVERTIKSYDTLFKVILRRGRYMMAKRYFNKMLSEGIEPTRHTYNLMIWGFFLSMRFETALRFFEEMKTRGIKPDAVTYNTLINGYCRVKKMEEAEKYFIEMKGRNIQPTVITYTTLLKGCISSGKVEDAWKLLKEMNSVAIKPNAITYSTLLPGLCEAEKMSEAHDVLNEMVEKNIAPKDNSIFIRLLSGQCKVGNLDAAGDVLKSMIRLHIPIEAGHYGVLIENFCKAGSYDRAVKLLDKLVEREIILRPQSTLHMQPSAYNPIIKYLCNNGHTSKAETLLRQLMKTGVEDSHAFNDVIYGHSKEGSPDSAYELLKIMVRRKIATDSVAYEQLIKSYLAKGEPADAKRALDGMVENGHKPSSSLYRLVMESLFEDGRVQTASKVMMTMLENGIKEHMDLITKILEALLLRGHVEEALGRIELMLHSGLAPNFDILLSVVCEKGKTVAALKLFDFGLQRHCHIDFKSYDMVLDALLAAGKTLNAYSLYCKILERDTSLCEGLIKSLTNEGNIKQADILSRIVKEMDKTSGSKKGKKVGGAIDKSLVESLIKSLNDEGNTKQADILSRMVKEKDTTADILSRMVKEKDKTADILSRMVKEKDKTSGSKKGKKRVTEASLP